MDRRRFVHTTGLSLASLLLHDSIFSLPGFPKKQLIQLPDEVFAVMNEQRIQLMKAGNQIWKHQDFEVSLENGDKCMTVLLQGPATNLSSVTLAWHISQKSSLKILNDHWERGYGDLSWHPQSATEMLPWYFMEYNGKTVTGFGVKTGAHTFCHWQMAGDQLTLTMDSCSGGRGVQLGDRKLKAAEIVTLRGNDDETPFQTARRFAALMCEKARMPKHPVYGINDWYFSYGNNSEKLILAHTEMMSPMADGLENRPFSVIDAGWFQNPPSMPNDCCWGDNMDTPDPQFGDMGALAGKIRKIGMRPGIWSRPLCGSYKDPASLMLPLIPGRENNKPILDPSIPENLERIKNYFRLYQHWGYELVKFDFTSFDIFGKWGFEMMKDKSMTTANWRMQDNTQTNAEIVLNLYKTIREAAGHTYIISCNTFSHLSAGLFELNRIGDDTSGNEWSRTRKMGVNSLAFRGIHQGLFYAADGDCVGLTPKVDWNKNRQWMELLANSGTPLFISAQPEATGAEQQKVIKECFQLASNNKPVAEPLDWLENPVPNKWKLNGRIREFNWD